MAASNFDGTNMFPLCEPIVPLDLALVLHYCIDVQVLICKLCGEGVGARNSVNHYVSKHGLHKGGLQSGMCVDLLNAIVRFCNTLTLREEQHFPIFADWQPPQPHLPILNGFKCRHCKFCTFDLQAVYEHVQQNHIPDHILPATGLGIPPQVDMLARVGSFITSCFMVVPMQTWVRGGRPWVVDPLAFLRDSEPLEPNSKASSQPQAAVAAGNNSG